MDDLTQHDIRKTIIEDFQRNSTKFTGEQRQDVIKWLKNLELKFETANIPPTKKFDLISQLLDKGALDWFQENKLKFNHSWDDFVQQFKKTFDSPNRARIAMQKLNSYAQLPQQDVRSFCSEMRKLFHEADPQMSSNMKLELLLAKINPSYRLDLLKQKPKDPEEFETMAKDLENTYIVYEALQQNNPSNFAISVESVYASTEQPFRSDSESPRSPSYEDYSQNNYRTSQPIPSRSRGPLTNSSSTATSSINHSSLQQRTPPRPSVTYQQRVINHNSPFTPRHRLSTYHLSNPSTNHSSMAPHDIPPLMSIPSSSSTSQLDTCNPSFQSSSLVCQLCSAPGHSARQCPF